MTIAETDLKRNIPMGTTEQNHALPPDQTPTPDRPGHTTESDLPGVGGVDGMGGYGRTFLTAPVGRNQENRADDVHKVSAFLAGNNLMPAATREANEDFLGAIEKGQMRLNELAGGGLQVDGIVKPWGPTEVLSQRAVSAGKMKTPSPNDPSPASSRIPNVLQQYIGDGPHQPEETPLLIDLLKSLSAQIRKDKNLFKNAKVIGGIKG
ncbi:hypothetical protein KFF05_16590 [bacterium SCSIO 12827]|nr:hypothetical protein KFF05_16590 [bacterium SCSIO 12827]